MSLVWKHTLGFSGYKHKEQKQDNSHVLQAAASFNLHLLHQGREAAAQPTEIVGVDL